MKKFKLLSIIVLALIFTSCNGQDKNKTNEKAQNISKIEVIDFHSTHRCVTCQAIEESTKYTLDNYFADELKSGKITFQVINVDKKENYALAEKFEASGTSLFLNVIRNGEEKQINLTDFAFMNGRNKEVFSKELKAKLDAELPNI